MIKHRHTETTEINFSKLEERLLQVNDPNLVINSDFFKQSEYLFRNVPTLIVATGGSKALGYYLKMFLEDKGTFCEVIEPRDYFYKGNVNYFKNLIVLSNSGKPNGLLDILRNFPGSSNLITSDYIMQEEDYKDNEPLFNTIYWSNEMYKDKEKSFISIIPTLAPMLMFLELSTLNIDNLSIEELKHMNIQLKNLLEKSKERINNIDFNFKDTTLIQIMSGYDTKVSSSILESNLIESGTSSVVIHDKGSFCHGRSNLGFQNPDSPIIYLSHKNKRLDDELLSILKNEYSNIFQFSTFDENKNMLFKEYYLSLQMFFLSKKIADDKNIDLTMPEYNPRVVKKLYKYRGEM